MDDICEPYNCFELQEVPEYRKAGSGNYDCRAEESFLLENPSEPYNDFEDYEEGGGGYSVAFPVIGVLKGEQTKENERTDYAIAESEDVPLTEDIYEPLDSFKADDNGDLYSQYLKPAALTGILAGKKGEKQADVDTEKRMPERKFNVREIADNLIQQRLFICMNGERLFMKKEDDYVQISMSPKSEIMYLKALLKRIGLQLAAPDCKIILNELKTEEDIWVERLESTREGRYDISFLSGRRMNGVSGMFADFLVSGQLKNTVQPFTDGIRLFVSECCMMDAALQTESTVLFCAYQNFMLEYPGYIVAKQNQFVPFMKKTYGLQGSSTGRVRVLLGVCLRNDMTG